MNLRFSKTDQNGRGKAIPISKELYELLMTWKDLAGEGYILRGINKYNNIMKRLTCCSVNRIVQDIQARSDMETEYPFSGHSFRVGGALDLLMRGVTMEKIMLRGGWSSESTVIKYLRAWDLMED
jgi:integrase